MTTECISVDNLEWDMWDQLTWDDLDAMPWACTTYLEGSLISGPLLTGTVLQIGVADGS